MTHSHDEAHGHDLSGRGHGQGHGQGHGHGHEHVHEDSENPWAGQGAVMLDIGDDVGALIVEMPRSTIGLEVEICRAGTPRDGSVHHEHVAVVDRAAGDTSVPSLVYPSLGEGTYELFEKGTDRVELIASVLGGQVTEATWPPVQAVVPRQPAPPGR